MILKIFLIAFLSIEISTISFAAQKEIEYDVPQTLSLQKQKVFKAMSDHQAYGNMPDFSSYCYKFQMHLKHVIELYKVCHSSLKKIIGVLSSKMYPSSKDLEIQELHESMVFLQKFLIQKEKKYTTFLQELEATRNNFNSNKKTSTTDKDEAAQKNQEFLTAVEDSFKQKNMREHSDNQQDKVEKLSKWKADLKHEIVIGNLLMEDGFKPVAKENTLFTKDLGLTKKSLILEVVDRLLMSAIDKKIENK